MQKEILLVAEAVSGEKGLPQEAIFEAIEQALATATKKRYSENSNIEVVIDHKTGDYETFRLWEVVSEELIEDQGTQVIQNDENVEIGSFIKEKVENVEFGRIAAQAAKQVIVQKVREAERAQVVEKYRSPKLHFGLGYQRSSQLQFSADISDRLNIGIEYKPNAFAHFATTKGTSALKLNTA